ncbi:MAG: efflux RND transporter periplasmic adaptor subunit [Chitinispirillaceae bacterium]
MKKHCLLSTAVALFLVSCGGKQETQQHFEKFGIRKVDLRDVISQTGEVQPLVKIELKSEASGRIDSVYVKEGQAVSKGDTLLRIDPSRLLYRKENMDLAVERSFIQRKIAERNLSEAKALRETGTISERQIIDLENEYELVDVSYRQEILERKDIIDQLGNTVVISPMDGVITALTVEQGEIAVSATSGMQSGTSIATIADIKRLEVVSQIGEVDYIHLKKGQSVVVRPEAREGTSTTGTIDFIALSAKKDETGELGTFEVRMSVDSIIPGIAPGINVKVDFVILEKKGVVGVPNRFVRKSPRGHMVQKLTPEGTVPQKVTVGHTDYRHYEILEGLAPGDTVVNKAMHERGEIGRNARGGRRG